MGKGGRNVRSHLPTASRDTQTTGPSRAEPCRSCPGRAEPDSLRLIGRDLFSLFAVAPASYDTLWKGGKCASVLKRRGEERRGAPLTVGSAVEGRENRGVHSGRRRAGHGCRWESNQQLLQRGLMPLLMEYVLKPPGRRHRDSVEVNVCSR
ncbi:Hypothetical predicted protein [Xyrichtys novacula]|uniref:Uncharacterized protein n=1 Tax=Xyrichtys novacula TaxID=13765 RepID=A0AAV1F4Z0_XYRNO|nr:Hypothetical predicted protein [Xyrichtys novacula]